MVKTESLKGYNSEPIVDGEWVEDGERNEGTFCSIRGKSRETLNSCEKSKVVLDRVNKNSLIGKKRQVLVESVRPFSRS